MNRETRNNLIFIVVLLALVTPGGVILFRKKSQPGARPIGAADVVINTTAFMDPYAGPTVERLAPAETMAWVDRITESLTFTKYKRPTTGPTSGPASAPSVLSYRKGSTVGSEIPFKDVPLANMAELAVSDGHWFHLAAMSTDLPRMARLVVWTEGRPTDAKVDGKQVRLGAYRGYDLPVEVRHNLQHVGFIDPPQRLSLIDIPFPEGAKQIELTFDPMSPKTDTLTVP